MWQKMTLLTGNSVAAGPWLLLRKESGRSKIERRREGLSNWLGNASPPRGGPFGEFSKSFETSEKQRHLRGYLQGYKISTRAVILRAGRVIVWCQA